MNEDDDISGGEAGSFKARLSAARERQGLDARAPAPAKGGSSGAEASALSVGLRVGVELVSALVVGVAIGYGLDRLLGTKPIFIAVFVLLGGAAGVLNVWRIYAPKRG
jgi:ATP synthase protein I